MAKDEPGNQTPNTPDFSETELREKKVDELRDLAREHGVQSPSGLRKAELVDAVAEKVQEEQSGSGGGQGKRGEGKSGGQGGGRGGGRDAERGEDGGSMGAGPDGGHIRTGPQTSKSLKYSQEVTSPEEEPERQGRSLVTTHHEVIRQWAEARGGRPATVEGTEHGDRLGVLRFDFGDKTDNLREVSWDEWFATFDERGLNFIYQEERTDGNTSTFFRLENPNREDA